MQKLLIAAAFLLGSHFTSLAQYDNQTIQIGIKAPELDLPTPDGKNIKLSSYNKGRYVLIDFWASWCGPCRRANPALVALYNKYKDVKHKSAKKGFSIYSVSLDRGKAEWVAAIAKDGLVWEGHVSDLGFGQSKAAKIYGVQYIPQAFLLDPNGKVVGKYMLAEEAAADLEKIFASRK